MLFLVYGECDGDDGLGEELVVAHRPVDTAERADACIAEYVRNIRVPVASPKFRQRHQIVLQVEERGRTHLDWIFPVKSSTLAALAKSHCTKSNTSSLRNRSAYSASRTAGESLDLPPARTRFRRTSMSKSTSSWSRAASPRCGDRHARMIVRASNGEASGVEREVDEKEGETWGWGSMSGGHGWDSCSSRRWQIAYPTPLSSYRQAHKTRYSEISTHLFAPVTITIARPIFSFLSISALPYSRRP